MSALQKSKMAMVIALLALLISILSLFDEYREAYGKPSIRQWLRAAIHK